MLLVVWQENVIMNGRKALKVTAFTAADSCFAVRSRTPWRSDAGNSHVSKVGVRVSSLVELQCPGKPQKAKKLS